PAAPLMHGTGVLFAMPVMWRAGSVHTPATRRFDPEALLDSLAADRTNGVCIVGDAFGRPLARALDASPGRWDLRSLKVMFSSGAMLSAETKAALLEHVPGLRI